jgi:hypothetical protein
MKLFEEILSEKRRLDRGGAVPEKNCRSGPGLIRRFSFFPTAIVKRVSFCSRGG